MRISHAAWFASSLLASCCLLACSTNEGGIVNGGGDDDDDGPQLGGDGGESGLDDRPAPAGCGNGELSDDEACDDANKDAGDGCAANCLSVELGFSCPTPGKACIPVARCGDGVRVNPEFCDDGNAAAGDGCSPTCKYEPGYKCEGSPSVCSPTVCADGKKEGAETCEDGNAMPFDGCSALCQNEPQCSVGEGCTSSCGDGVVVNEECDDGNNMDGDGCSSTCTEEKGYTCRAPDLGETMKVPLVVRDFNAGGDFEKSGDFAMNLHFANQGLLKPQLEGKLRRPVLAATTGTYNGQAGKASGIASPESFAMWYDETAPAAVNVRNGSALATTLTLFLNDEGKAYVNRYGNGGDGLTPAKYETTRDQNCIEEAKVAYDETGAVMPCWACYYDSNPDTPECDGGAQACNVNNKPPDRCALVNGTYVGTAILKSNDGNPLFFPADPIEPYSPSKEGQDSGNYDDSWPVITGKQHNFSFTSEVRYWFQYNAATDYQLRFVGDDDVWVFINGILAVDLGGIHTAVQGDLTSQGGVTSVTVTATQKEAVGTPIVTAPDLGLKDGGVYEVVVLHAERQTTASSYQLTLSGFSSQPSDCTAVCGDGVVGIGEQCDDGINDGGYGECGENCRLTEFCGDGTVQEDYGEECDDGNNIDGDDCGSACRNITIY